MFTILIAALFYIFGIISVFAYYVIMNYRSRQRNLRKNPNYYKYYRP